MRQSSPPETCDWLSCSVTQVKPGVVVFKNFIHLQTWHYSADSCCYHFKGRLFRLLAKKIDKNNISKTVAMIFPDDFLPWTFLPLKTSDDAFICKNTKGDYLSLTEMKSRRSPDGRLVILLRRLMIVVSPSVSFQESKRAVIFFFLAQVPRAGLSLNMRYYVLASDPALSNLGS